MRRLIVLGLLAGCSSSEPPATGRPAGVALCYSQTSSSLPATMGYWDVMLAADYARRPAALDALAAAVDAHPGEEELALLSGLGNLWKLAEPTEAEAQDPGGTLVAVATAKAEVQRAFDLCPTDYRIPAWLGPILVNAGRKLGDEASVDMGLSVLQVGIDHYPSFVLFSKLLVYADRPASDPDFKQALDAVDANIQACGDLSTTRDPACLNTPHAVHNVEGAAVFLGDAYAKAGRRADALKVYGDAQHSPDYASWPFRAVLEQRIDQIDARLAAYAAGQEPEAAWSSTSQCSLCHRR